MTANDDSATKRRKASPPRIKGTPRSPGTPPWLPLLLMAVAMVTMFGAFNLPAALPRSDQGSWSGAGRLPAARVEGRAAHYHLTFANFAQWHLKADPPTKPGVQTDRWYTYGSEDVHVIAVVIPVELPDLDASVDLVLQNSKKQFSSFTEVERTVLTDRADRGVLVRVRGTREGTLVEMFLGFFADEGAVYEITALATPLTFSRLGRELEAVVRSFELPPPEPVPSALPRPPLPLAAPLIPTLTDEEKRHQRTELLAIQAHVAAGKGDYALAAQLQQRAVAAGVRGKYNLACYYGQDGQIDASLYWLESAIDEGVDPRWAEQDPDLEKVRADPRWSTIRPFLREASRYWAGSGLEKTLVVVPKGYTPGRPIPVVVGLHGMGSVPDDFADEELQDTADALSIAFVSASGTIPNGPVSFHWAESVDRDDVRLDHALKEASDRVTVAPGKIILIGFSQGAQMAAEIAARRPEKYLGAIIMSPGTQSDLALQDLVATPALAQHRFVIVVGAGEHPGNVAQAANDARALRGAHADVFHKPYEGMNRHSFPPDFTSALPVWIKYILGSGPKPPGGATTADPAVTK